MTKHSKNNTNGAVFTYHERKRMDHGSEHLRLPGDAMKQWDKCALALAPASTPVVTPQGVLYEKEAIFKNLLQQKRDAKQQKKDNHILQRHRMREESEKLALQRESTQRKFEQQQQAVHPGPAPASTDLPPDVGTLRSNFWLPDSDVPVEKSREVTKHSLRTRCPISKKPLRSKDLIVLKPTANKFRSEDPASKSTSVRRNAGMYMCPVCQTTLVNAVHPVALRTGTVLCLRCVNDFVKKEMRDPCTSAPIDVQRDIIPIQNAGTAFAGSVPDDPSSREASLYRPSAR